MTTRARRRTVGRMTTNRNDDWPCDVHGPGDDDCVNGPRGRSCVTSIPRDRRIEGMGARSAVCRRHGETLEPGKWPDGNGCWECDMEAAEARAERLEHERAYRSC